jgi:hypothetical protein
VAGQDQVVGATRCRDLDVRELPAADDFTGPQQHAARVGLGRDAARGA